MERNSLGRRVSSLTISHIISYRRCPLGASHSPLVVCGVVKTAARCVVLVGVFIFWRSARAGFEVVRGE